MIKKVKTWADEFKSFAVRGNVIDMAVGIIIDFANLYFTLPTKLNEIGAMPHYDSLEAAKAAGAVTINYGVFINTLISFVMVAFAVFLIIKAVNKLKASADKEAAEVAPATKVCPKCFSEININATRCPHCTSDI